MLVGLVLSKGVNGRGDASQDELGGTGWCTGAAGLGETASWKLTRTVASRRLTLLGQAVASTTSPSCTSSMTALVGRRFCARPMRPSLRSVRRSEERRVG